MLTSGKNMAERTKIKLAGGTLKRVRDVCAFFRNVDEEVEVLLPFLEEGLERGERVLFIVGAKQRHEYLSRLRGEGHDVASAQRRGQIEVLSWEEFYLR